MTAMAMLAMDSIEAAAKASDISVDEAIKNVSNGLRQAQQPSGKSSSGAASD